MNIPKELLPLVDDGVIVAVMRPLKSGKEAAVCVVRTGDDVICAKVYKNREQRSFQQRVQYQQGRNLRDTLPVFAPELATTHFGEEMWALYERAS